MSGCPWHPLDRGMRAGRGDRPRVAARDPSRRPRRSAARHPRSDPRLRRATVRRRRRASAGARLPMDSAASALRSRGVLAGETGVRCGSRSRLADRDAQQVRLHLGREVGAGRRDQHQPGLPRQGERQARDPELPSRVVSTSVARDRLGARAGSASSTAAARRVSARPDGRHGSRGRPSTASSKRAYAASSWRMPKSTLSSPDMISVGSWSTQIAGSASRARGREATLGFHRRAMIDRLRLVRAGSWSADHVGAARQIAACAMRSSAGSTGGMKNGSPAVRRRSAPSDACAGCR